jgi:hypothetical protein
MHTHISLITSYRVSDVRSLAITNHVPFPQQTRVPLKKQYLVRSISLGMDPLMLMFCAKYADSELVFINLQSQAEPSPLLVLFTL